MAERVRMLSTGVALTDLGTAERFVREHKDRVRYVKSESTWLVWDGKRWARDSLGRAEQLAKQTLRRMVVDAQEGLTDQDRRALTLHALESESAARLRSMLELARTEEELSVPADAFNRSPMLFNVENGTLDLERMELRPHNQSDYITQLAGVAYDHSATCPRWELFLAQILGASLAAFLQRAIGYALTGKVAEHAFFVLHGMGSNGKSTFLEALRGVFGDYACHSPFETFLAKRDDAVRNDIARLAGARLATACEVEEGRRFSESLLKQLTGGDTITARKLYQEHREFRPQFKLFLAANHRPHVWGTDHAIWRRIHLVPFTVSIPDNEQDHELAAKLAAERSGILNWALRGLASWKAEGLNPPPDVRAATEAYRSEEDLVGAFLGERCRADGPHASVEKRVLYDDYVSWTHDSGVDALSVRLFNKRIAERGFVDRKTNGKGTWRGLRLLGLGESNEARETTGGGLECAPSRVDAYEEPVGSAEVLK